MKNSRCLWISGKTATVCGKREAVESEIKNSTFLERYKETAVVLYEIKDSSCLVKNEKQLFPG